MSLIMGYEIKNVNDVTITNTSDKSVLYLYRNSTNPADSDFAGEIIVKGRNDNSQDVAQSSISNIIFIRFSCCYCFEAPQP